MKAVGFSSDGFSIVMLPASALTFVVHPCYNDHDGHVCAD